MFGAETGFVAFWDEEHGRISDVVVIGGEHHKRYCTCYRAVSRKVLQRARPAIIHKLNKDIRSMMVCPITAGGEPVGAFGLISPSKRRPFSEADLRRFAGAVDKHIPDLFSVKVQYSYCRQLTNLRALYDISQAVRETHDLGKLLHSIMDAARESLNAEASSLAIIDEKSGDLIFTVVEGEKGGHIKEIRLKMGQGIIGWVAQQGKPLLIADARKDKRFFRGADERTGFTTRSVLCVPLMVRNNAIGAVEVLNKKDGSSFTRDDAALLSVLAGDAAGAIDNTRLFTLATTDGLTGACTIRYFRTLLENEYSRSLRFKHQLSLILSDIDHFKKVNDTYGHQTGDLILRDVSSALRKGCRDIDVVGRYGGEEFIIMLPETPRDSALVLAERLRKEIERHVSKDADGKQYRVTISMGVSSLTGKESQEELIKLADTALYKAKETGRNRVCSS